MKAFEYLNWKTLLSAKVSLKMTFEWYKKFYDKKSNNEILKFTFNQIKDYLKKLNEKQHTLAITDKDDYKAMIDFLKKRVPTQSEVTKNLRKNFQIF